MADFRDVLRQQFVGVDGSFLFRLRGEFEWDRDAFSVLISAMRECCEALEGSEVLERWLAEGFWYLSTFVQGHTMHPHFKRVYSMDYYKRSFKQLFDLADWFFTGQYPYNKRLITDFT